MMDNNETNSSEALKIVANAPVPERIEDPFDLDAMLDGMEESYQSTVSASQQVCKFLTDPVLHRGRGISKLRGPIPFFQTDPGAFAHIDHSDWFGIQALRTTIWRSRICNGNRLWNDYWCYAKVC